MAADRGESPHEESARVLPEGEARREPATPASERDVDAMGLEKRRGVVGGSYGPSFTKQMTAYGAFLLIVAVLAGGFYILARELDQPPDTVSAEAPWAQPEVEQVEPRPLDFPRNGPTEIE